MCVLRASSLVSVSYDGKGLWSVLSPHDELTGVALPTMPCIATSFTPQSLHEAGAVLTTYTELELEKLTCPRALGSKDRAGF